MARFRNDTGSVLHSQDFGAIGPGEFEATGYDPDIHGVIPGCTRLDAPPPEDPPAAGDAMPPEDISTPGVEGGEQDEETSE